MVLKPKQGKVIINYKGKQIELPTKATKEILSIPAVKTFLSKGIVELVEEKEDKQEQPKVTKEEFKSEEKPKQENKSKRGRSSKKK